MRLKNQLGLGQASRQRGVVAIGPYWQRNCRSKENENPDKPAKNPMFAGDGCVAGRCGLVVVV